MYANCYVSWVVYTKCSRFLPEVWDSPRLNPPLVDALGKIRQQPDPLWFAICGKQTNPTRNNKRQDWKRNWAEVHRGSLWSLRKPLMVSVLKSKQSPSCAALCKKEWAALAADCLTTPPARLDQMCEYFLQRLLHWSEEGSSKVSLVFVYSSGRIEELQNYPPFLGIEQST